MLRRTKILALTANLLRRCNSQLCAYDAVDIHALCLFVHSLRDAEKLPRDVVIGWLWYDPAIGANCVILWSEMFPIVPEGERAPYIENC